MTASPLLTPPLQARSRRSLEKLVAAGEALLTAEGPEAVTVAAVTKRARVSVGSFYARFPGIEDFLRHLGEAALERTISEWVDTRASLRQAGRSHYAPVSERVEWAVGTLTTLLREGPGRVVLRLDGVHDPGPTRVFRLEAFLGDELESALGARPPKARIAARTAVALLRPPPVDHAPLDPASGEEETAGELAVLLTAYLVPPPMLHTSEPEPDPFDVWG